MTDILATPDETSNINNKPPLSNGSPSVATTISSSPSSDKQATKPTTMPVSRKIRLQQMLWHSLMEAKGEIVGVTKTNGDTYSGVLFAIEAADNDTIDDPNAIDNDTENTNAAWKYIVLKYVQKMSDPNMNPSERIRAPFEEELKIPASDFAALSAINITDHTNSYRRSNRQAFNDASGTKLHRKQRELVRWEAIDADAGDLENEDDLNDLRNGDYDQFKANEKYNINATFDENLYTSNLDKTNPNYSRNLKEAKIREQHIMSQATDNKHVADDRAYYNAHNQHNMHMDKDEDEEDAYSRVLHEASLSKQSLKDSKKKNSYVAPHMRGKPNSNTQNQGKNKGRNKQHNKGQNNNNNNNKSPDRHRPPMSNNNNNNKKKNKGNNNQNNATQNSLNINHNNNESNNANVVNGVGNNNNSPTHNINSPSQQQQQAQTSQALLQQASLQNQMLQQAKLAQLTANPIFAGLPPHIAQIVQSVNPTQTAIPQTMQLTQQQLQVYQQLVLAQQNLSLAQQAQAAQAQQTGNTETDMIGESEEMKDDGALNPHAIEFTPQMSPTPKQQTQTAQSIASAQPTQLLTQQQQQQQALQAQILSQQPLGQYNFNPATGQYVLNPYAAQQGQQQQQQAQQLQLLQQQQHNAYLQQLAIQQQLQLQQAQGQTDPSGTITSQQILAQHQHLALQQQHALLAQQVHVQAQAQANGLNIDAPLFTPTNIPTQGQGGNNQLALQQQAQQQAILAQHQQLQQQQYLAFGSIPQQLQIPQFYMQNM